MHDIFFESTVNDSVVIRQGMNVLEYLQAFRAIEEREAESAAAIEEQRKLRRTMTVKEALSR